MDEILYKEARNTVQALIKDKKRKSKELGKIIKKLGLANKKVPTITILPQYEKGVDIFSLDNRIYF